jgi:nuclear transcription Y subunit beta
MKEKRKTINGDDLIWSMGTLGFEDYVEPLKLYLKLYREVFLFSPSTLYREFIYLITLYRELILHRLFALRM